VAILDFGMPGAGGYAVAEMLCEALERKPLLEVLTGYHTMEEQSRAAGIAL